MSPTLVSWAMLIVPWLSLFFINKNSLKRFMPVTIFTALQVSISWQYAVANHWFVEDFRLFPSVVTNVPIVLGAFFIITLWIFHFTYGNFWLYLLVNIVSDALHSYPITMFYDYIGLLHLERASSLRMLLLSLSHAIVAYLFQLWLDSAFKSQIREAGGAGPDDFEPSALSFRRKEKAR